MIDWRVFGQSPDQRVRWASPPEQCLAWLVHDAAKAKIDETLMQGFHARLILPGNACFSPNERFRKRKAIQEKIVLEKAMQGFARCLSRSTLCN
jgi:hypothetical protein